MSLYEEFLKSGEVAEYSMAKAIVYSILSDLTDRRGLRQAFDQIDDEIKEELIESWIEIVERKMGI